jgi:hypothetical protein
VRFQELGGGIVRYVPCIYVNLFVRDADNKRPADRSFIPYFTGAVYVLLHPEIYCHLFVFRVVGDKRNLCFITTEPVNRSRIPFKRLRRLFCAVLMFPAPGLFTALVIDRCQRSESTYLTLPIWLAVEGCVSPSKVFLRPTYCQLSWSCVVFAQVIKWGSSGIRYRVFAQRKLQQIEGSVLVGVLCQSSVAQSKKKNLKIAINITLAQMRHYNLDL